MKKDRIISITKESLILFGKGFWIGSTMTVPGISGGTMAMLAGCYQQLVEAVSHFFAHPGRALALLVPVGCGGMLGMWLVSGLFSEKLLVYFPWETRYAFLGVVAGSVPMVVHGKEKDGRFRGKKLLWIIVGVALAVLFSLAFQRKVDGTSGMADTIWLQIVVGTALAGALVLPGISTSQVLWMTGMYEPVLQQIHAGAFMKLIPMGIGTLIGIFAFAWGMECCWKKYPMQLWAVIGGFVLASCGELFPGIPPVEHVGRCILLFGAAGLIMLWIGKIN